MKPTLALLALLVFAAPASASEFCVELGDLGRTQAEARDRGVTRSEARRVNAQAEADGIGDLSESISDLVRSSAMDPDTIALVVTAACLQAEE